MTLARRYRRTISVRTLSFRAFASSSMFAAGAWLSACGGGGDGALPDLLQRDQATSDQATADGTVSEIPPEDLSTSEPPLPDLATSDRVTSDRLASESLPLS